MPSDLILLLRISQTAKPQYSTTAAPRKQRKFPVIYLPKKCIRHIWNGKGLETKSWTRSHILSTSLAQYDHARIKKPPSSIPLKHLRTANRWHFLQWQLERARHTPLFKLFGNSSNQRPLIVFFSFAIGL